MTAVWLVGYKRCGGKAGFGEGDGEAAVGKVVGGIDEAFRCESDETVDEALFGGQVDGWWFAGDDGGDGFRVFRGGEFAGAIRTGERRAAKIGRASCRERV